MNKRSFVIVILLSGLSMMGIIWLQVKWIAKAAELKDEQFNNHVEIASWWVSEQLELQLSKDTLLMAETDSVAFHRKIYTKVDSLSGIILTWFSLKDMNPVLEVIPNTDTVSAFTFGNNTFRSAAAKPLKDRGLEFRLTFQDKEKWIISQLKHLLISSFVLIVLIIGCFVYTLKTLWAQKKIFEKTTDFISNMTHEFKTPITNVSLASNLLAKESSVLSAEKIRKYNTIVVHENNKLKHHVEQILKLARLERGELPLQKVSFDIHDAIEEAIDPFLMQIKVKNGKLKKEFSASMTTILGDKMHISNSIINLLDNANKYCGKNPEILVKTFNQNDGIIVAIEDNGIGMNKEQQKYVFDKFYRVPTGNEHNVKGFGLGLSYVKMVVKSHRGSIKLKSEYGKGSCFELFFPTIATS